MAYPETKSESICAPYFGAKENYKTMKGSTAFNQQAFLLLIVTFGLLNSVLSPLSLWPIAPGKVYADQFIPGPAIEGSVFAVTASNKLILFNQSAPSAVINSVAIGGLQASEQINRNQLRWQHSFWNHQCLALRTRHFLLP